MLACAVWLVCVSFPLLGQPQAKPSAQVAAIPPDPHEPVTGTAQIAATPSDRASALALFERASQNSKLLMPGTPPYRLHVSFTAMGGGANSGAGELTELWLSGRDWRWAATLGSNAVDQVSSQGRIANVQGPGPVPMRVHMLRNAIFWARRTAPDRAQVRTAAVHRDSRPATCLLLSGIVTPEPQGRIWEEEEFCIDNASGALLLHSIAPGTYEVYGYGKGQQFHGRYVPDRITIYVNREAVVDAQVSLTDLGAADPSTFALTPEMIANGPVTPLVLPMRMPLNVPGASTSTRIEPAIIHASIDGNGKVLEEEVSSAADAAIVQSALDVVRNTNFAPSGSQVQAYINVRFLPAAP
jgi:hypothetical protein